MADEEIKAGDTVRLKSGGPSMTVEAIGHFGWSDSSPLEARCSWFDKSDLKSSVFPLTALTKE